MTLWSDVAVYSKRIGGATIQIHDVDHGPPHCHISGLSNGATAKVSLVTMQVTKPLGLPLPKTLMRALRNDQTVMLEAWDSVISINRGE